MPSEGIHPQGGSPSFSLDDVSFRDEREVGFWKADAMPSSYGIKTEGILSPIASPHLQKRVPLDSQMVKGLEHPVSYLNRDQKVDPLLEKFGLGSEKATSLSLHRALDYNLGYSSYFTAREKVNFMGAPYENGLFSSSLSELFTRKLRFSSNINSCGHSFGAANPHEEEEPFESLKELEAQTIGNLLPDEEDLFSGVTDGFDIKACPISREDLEDLDFFSNVGGLELGEDGSSPVQMNPGAFSGDSGSQLGGSNGTTGGERPSGEHPSRTLFVCNINSNLEDSELQALFEQYGDIRTLYTACKHRGFVMISYYDTRAAQNAMRALQNKPLRHGKLDIHDSIPKIHQTPHISHHKFMEFYDVRAAEAAFHALNRSEIAGKTIKVEPSYPSGARRSLHRFSSDLDQDESGFHMQQSSSPANLTPGFSVSRGGNTANVDNGIILGARSIGSLPMSPHVENPFHYGISCSVPSSLPSLLRAESIGNQSDAGEASNSLGQLNFDICGAPNLCPHSLPDCHDGLANGALSKSPGNMAASMRARSSELLETPFSRVSSNGHSIELNENVFNISGNGSCPSPGHHYMWSNSLHPPPQSMMWPKSPSFISGTYSACPQQFHAVPRAVSHLTDGLLSMNNHHVGSAPSVNPSLWERQHAYAGESPDASVLHPGSLGSLRIPGSSPFVECIPHNLFPQNGGSCMDLPIPLNNIQLHSHSQRGLMIPARGQMIPLMSSFGSPNERTRSCRHEGSSSQADCKKQFELDIDQIVDGEDKRTTLMIKNIPNKYTSKMLLAAIDEQHRGTYDFLYLPIDFKNKCNVGYAFINMTDPSLIVPFYHAFNGKKWEKFNSEKVATLAYARIQGKAALIAHFQNSSLMNEDKRCRPILFHTDGPNAGDQVPFPMGVNIRPRPSKVRSSTVEENDQEGSVNTANREESCTGSSSSVSIKDSD